MTAPRKAPHAPYPAAGHPDLGAYWLPFTPNRDFKRDPRLVVRAEGVWLWNERGDRILDASSGLFCVNAGHGRREIAEAVGRQLAELDYIAPFLRGHPKQFELAERVAALTPDGLDRIFFVNSGSEAVDTAMKIALAWHHARGQAGRTMFVSRERAYHGVNFGGVSLSGMVNNRRRFGPGLPGVVHMRHTQVEANRFVRGQGTHGADLADDLQRFVDLYGAENIAACFVEPIAGSTGVLVPPAGYLERLRDLCTRHGILLVFDEVICGFGRTGTPFAAQSFGVTPDIMTMAKALTNGAQPMGAVAVRTDIYDTVLDAAPDGTIEFFHGYTYSGHPAACAAGLAALDIYAREDLFARGRDLSPYFLDAIFSLRDVPVVADLRGYGLLAGIELHPDGPPGARGYRWQRDLFDAGVHVKTTGDAAIIAPPLVAAREHIDRLADVLRQTLKRLA